jgi:hypothetical protein
MKVGLHVLVVCMYIVIMIRTCSYSGCGNRRVHHERPHEMRKPVTFEVPDDVTEDIPVYCSLECSYYDDNGRVAELADAADSKSVTLTGPEGSTPSLATK